MKHVSGRARVQVRYRAPAQSFSTGVSAISQQFVDCVSLALMWATCSRWTPSAAAPACRCLATILLVDCAVFPSQKSVFCDAVRHGQPGAHGHNLWRWGPRGRRQRPRPRAGAQAHCCTASFSSLHDVATQAISHAAEAAGVDYGPPLQIHNLHCQIPRRCPAGLRCNMCCLCPDVSCNRRRIRLVPRRRARALQRWWTRCDRTA